MHNKAMNEEIMIRYFSGNANVDELQQLLAWTKENPENERNLFILKDIYEANASANLSIEAQTEAGWRKLQEMIKNSESQKLINNNRTKFIDWSVFLLKYTAIFLIGALLGSITLYFSSRADNKTSTAIAKRFEIKTEKGERVTIYLPDSSKVVLNACSYLSYPADFGEKTRELTLTGEGYFDVRTNQNMPFTVKTSGLNIKAFGTIFNVRAYSDEDMVETTLVKGIVSIETQANKNIVSLQPAQVVTIPKELIRTNREYEYSSRTASDEITVKRNKTVIHPSTKLKEAVLIEKINTEVYTSWKDNKWVIESESLESLAKKIERKYDVTISIEGETVKNYVFSGTLRYYPLEQVLETIKLNAPIRYTINEKNVKIIEDKYLKMKYEKLIQ